MGTVTIWVCRRRRNGKQSMPPPPPPLPGLRRGLSAKKGYSKCDINLQDMSEPPPEPPPPPYGGFQQLPTGWVEQLDEASGSLYYYNPLTGESRWERPVTPQTGTCSA